MEVGNSSDIEIDTLLLQQFSCMATQDKEALIAQFENLFGNSKPSREVCAFYLEMNNWNLPAAVGSYFELQQDTTVTTTTATTTSSSSSPQQPAFFPTPMYFSPNTNTASMPSACLENDFTSMEEQKVLIRPPNFKFYHSWKVKNNGLSTWPAGCTLRFTSGIQMSLIDRVSVDRLAPFSVEEVGVHLTTPREVGSYESTWQLSTMTGMLFGDEMRIYIQVTDDINLLTSLGFDTTLINSEMMTSDDCGDNNVMLLSSMTRYNDVNNLCRGIGEDGGDDDVILAGGGFNTPRRRSSHISKHDQSLQYLQYRIITLNTSPQTTTTSTMTTTNINQPIDSLDSDYMEMS